MTLDHQSGSVQCPHCRKPCQCDECEIITHTAVQQWDLLLEISQQWVAIDVGEIGTGEEEEEKSFIDDGSVAATERLVKAPTRRSVSEWPSALSYQKLSER